MKENNKQQLGDQGNLDSSDKTSERQPNHQLGDSFGDPGKKVKETNSEVFISLAKASEQTGYHQDYLGQLARSGRLEAQKIGRNWVTTRKAIDKFLGREVEVEEVKVIAPEQSKTESKSEVLPIKIYEANKEAGVNVQESLIKYFPPGSKMDQEGRNVLSRFAKIWEVQKAELEMERQDVKSLRDEMRAFKAAYVSQLARQKIITSKILQSSIDKKIVVEKTQRTRYPSLLIALLVASSIISGTVSLVYVVNDGNFKPADYLVGTQTLNEKKIAGESTSSLYLWPPPFVVGKPTPVPSLTPRLPLAEDVETKTPKVPSE